MYKSDLFLCAGGIHAPQAASWRICVELIKSCDFCVFPGQVICAVLANFMAS